MFVFIPIFVILISTLFVYWGMQFYPKLRIGRDRLSKWAVPFRDMTKDYRKTLLVLGDSSGVGVGATRPEESVGALLSHDMKATYTENLAVSGAIVSDVPKQLTQMALERYDTILLQIGGNDITHFHALDKVSLELAAILDSLKKRAERVLLMSVGDVGAAPIFPLPLRFFYTRLTLKYHAAFAAVAARTGTKYINLYVPPAEDPFIKNPSVYFAADSFHPSSAGYALWYERLKKVVAPLL